MTLRALTATITFQDKASAPLKALDSGINNVTSGVQATESSFVSLGSTTSNFADTAGKDISRVGDEVKQLEKDTEDVEATTEKSTGILSSGWTKVGAAIGAASIALEAFSRQQSTLGVSAERVAYTMGLEASEIKNVALNVTSATFSLEDAYFVMEKGSKAGIRDIDVLQRYAQSWDAISTATGESLDGMMKASIGLQAVGIEIGNEAEAMDALGYIATQTTGSVTEFLVFLGKAGPGLRKMEMDVNDAAAITGALGKELGMTAMTARTEFMRAVSVADGDTEIFMETLGLTTEQLEAYKDEIASSAGGIEHMSGVVNESKTPIENLTASVAKLAHQYGGDLIPIMSMLSPVMAVASSAMIMFAVIQTTTLIPTLKATAISVKALTMSFLASPLGPIIILVGVLAGILILVATHFDEIKEAATKAWEWIKGLFDGITEWFAKFNLLEIGKNIIHSLIDGIKSGIQALKDAVTGIGDTIIGGIKGIFGIASPSTVMMEFGVNMGEGLEIGLTEETSDFFNSSHRMDALIEPLSSTSNLEGRITYDRPTPNGDMAICNTSTTSNIRIGDINVYTDSGDPQDIAAEIERSLRRTFGDHANRYFAQQTGGL